MYLPPMRLLQPTPCMCIAKHPPTIILATSPQFAYHTRWFHRYALSCSQTNQLKKHARTASYLVVVKNKVTLVVRKLLKMQIQDTTDNFLPGRKKRWFVQILFHILSIKLTCLIHRIYWPIKFYEKGPVNSSQNKELHIWIATCEGLFWFAIIKLHTKRINGSQIAAAPGNATYPHKAESWWLQEAVPLQGCWFLGVVSLTNRVVSKKSVTYAQKE